MKNAPTMIFALLMLLAGTDASAFCFKEAGDLYHIEPALLEAIAKQESSLNPNAFHLNKDGTFDFSLMQINSTWLKSLKRVGITKRDLVVDPCLSVHVGAKILSQNLSLYRGDKNQLWSAVGAYNAGTTPKNNNKRIDYAWRIYKRMTVTHQ